MSAYQKYLEEQMPMAKNRPRRGRPNPAPPSGGGGGGFRGGAPPSPGLGTGAPAPYLFEDGSHGYPGMQTDPLMALLADILNRRMPNNV